MTTLPKFPTVITVYGCGKTTLYPSPMEMRLQASACCQEFRTAVWMHILKSCAITKLTPRDMSAGELLISPAPGD